MMREKLPERIDEKRLGELALAAAKSGDCSDKELGEMVRVMVKKLMSTDEFRLFTEDWVPEMVSAAYVSVFKAMPRLDLEKFASPYNYLYTTARNALRKEAERLKRHHDRYTPELGIGEFTPSEKRRALSKMPPVSLDEERNMVRAASNGRRRDRVKLLAVAIRLAAARFERRLAERGESLAPLIEMVKQRKEAWKKTC